MPAFPAIPGLWCDKEWSSAPKRRHFVVEGQVLKLFGRRGKTFKGQFNLLTVVTLRPATDSAAPPGTFELQVRISRTRSETYFMAPDNNHAELFMALGNTVPSHATSEELWRTHMRSRPATSTAHEYRLGKTLGVGTFGKVKLAQRITDGKLVAIKCLNRSRIVLAAQGGRLAREIQLLKLLNHPNVIRLYEVLHTPAEVLMVMEYVEGGDLLEVLNTQARFKEEEARHLFAQIVCGVSFCHSLGVAHRDLKPENILIERRGADIKIRVADFGLSTLMSAGEFLSTACGSPHYVAPEVLNFDGTARYDGRESDVWSLGVILHVLLRYKLPFEAESTTLLYKKIRQGLPSLPSVLTPSARELLQRMLEVRPELRITLDQVSASEWLRLEVEVPQQLSRTVDAVVDHSVISESPTPWAVLRADKLPPARGEAIRRAYTFDALPRSFSDADMQLNWTQRAARFPGHHRRHGSDGCSARLGSSVARSPSRSSTALSLVAEPAQACTVDKVSVRVAEPSNAGTQAQSGEVH